MPQALAVEMFHNFSLIHDDIMDQAPIRRGKPSAHQKFGVDRAILSGDAMLVLSYQYLVKGLHQGGIKMALDLFSKTSLQICRGQQLDLDFATSDVVHLPQYLKMIKLKTAVLLGTAMALGGIKAKASKAAVKTLRKCGIAMGMAFQLQDDLLDVFGDPLKTGKQKGGDILQNKKTVLYLKATDIADPRLKAELETLYGEVEINPSEKIGRVVEIYQALGVEQHAQALTQKYTVEGLSRLNDLPVSTSRKGRIYELFEHLIHRES